MMTRPLLAVFFTFCLLAALPGAASPPVSVTVGDPVHPKTLAQSVQNAYNGGARRIVIRPGVYVRYTPSRRFFVSQTGLSPAGAACGGSSLWKRRRGPSSIPGRSKATSSLPRSCGTGRFP